jgi:hypothetical protein
VEYSDRLISGLGVEARQDVIRLKIQDGKVTDAVVRGSGWHHESFGDWYSESLQLFYAWVDATYPGELATGGAIPVWTDQELATWAAYSLEFLATLDQ